MPIILSSIGSSTEERAREIIERYIEFPETAQEIHTHYIGLGQGRTGYAIFKLSHSEVEDFLATTCEEVVGGTRFDMSTEIIDPPNWLLPMPDWWQPQDEEFYWERLCDQDNVTIGIGVSAQADVDMIYMVFYFP